MKRAILEYSCTTFHSAPSTRSYSLCRKGASGLVHASVALLLCALLDVSADETNITVYANTPDNGWNQWLSTELDVQTGDTVTITATGQATTATSRPLHGPDGTTAIQAHPTESMVNTANIGALVGMVDDPPGSISTSPPFQTNGMYLVDDGSGPGVVGSFFSQIMPSSVSGTLYIGFNDGYDSDNSGSYVVHIEIVRGAGNEPPEFVNALADEHDITFTITALVPGRVHSLWQASGLREENWHKVSTFTPTSSVSQLQFPLTNLSHSTFYQIQR